MTRHSDMSPFPPFVSCLVLRWRRLSRRPWASAARWVGWRWATTPSVAPDQRIGNAAPEPIILEHDVLEELRDAGDVAGGVARPRDEQECLYTAGHHGQEGQS